MVSRDALTVRRAGALPRWWLSVAVLVPVEASVALRGKGAGDGALLQKHTAQSDSDDEGSYDDDPKPTCSCDCCDVVRRLPGEVSSGAGIKCSPSLQHSADMCTEQCSPEKGDRVLTDDVVDFERFCFFECKPAAGPKSPDKSQCVSFSEQEATQTIDPAGNPIDPAFLYGTVPTYQSLFRSGPPVYGAAAASANLLSRGSRVVQGAPADGAAAKKVMAKGKSNAEAEVKDATKESARLRQMEHIKQKELHEHLLKSGDGVVTLDPFAAIQDLNAAATHTRVDAQEAAIQAAKAVDAYDDGRRKIWKLALSEAGKEVLRWKKYAEDKAAKELAARFAPTWQSKAILKAQKASQPYIESMLRAQESVKLYNEKGFATANEASKLWKEAQFDSVQANKLPRATIAQANMAQSDMLDARSKGKEAQAMALEARGYFATAAEVRKGIPQFQYSAQKAAAAAVAAMNGPR